MPTFDEWYARYPRKLARKDAERAWKRMTPEQQFAAFESLPIHIRYWELSGRTKEFVPYPASWLNGERWTDELEMPVSKTDSDWHRSTEGITRKAKEVGVTPRPGEDWHSLKARILAKVAA